MTCHAWALLTLGVHAQRGLQYLGCLSVCLSVCLFLNISLLECFSSHKRYYLPNGSEVLWRFSWNDCVREICRENKRKSQLHNLTGLTATWSASSVYLCGAQEVTTNGDSRMLSTTVANPCQTLRELLAGDHDFTSKRIQIAQPIN